MTLAKKSLGQHFLRNPVILAKIVAAACLAPNDTVLEVGPGEGTLTELLLQHAGKVIAVEKDDRLIPILKKKFASEISAGKLQLIHADILFFSPSAFHLMPNAYKIVANLPYYITGAFLRKFLGGVHQPTSMTLLLQKEVARRIVAPASPRLRRAGKESVLSISVKCYGDPRIVAVVKAGSFSPPPKVDSAILTVENISKEFFAERSEGEFFAMLKNGFTHPRKLLASNLGVEGATLEQCGVPAKARAEDLALEQWREITSHLNHSK